MAQIAQSVTVPIMGMGGIGSWRDAAEYLAAGAGAVQVCTEVMVRGVGIIRSLQEGLRKYLVQKGFESPEPLVGAAVKKLGSHEQLSRKYAVKANWAAPEELFRVWKMRLGLRRIRLSGDYFGRPRGHDRQQLAVTDVLCAAMSARREAIRMIPAADLH